jgi:hypothetical protein
MKLKSFMKVSISTCTTYTIINGDSVVDYFTVDYSEKDQEKLSKNIIKRMNYGSADVRFVNVVNGRMHVDCEIKG